MDPRVLAEAAEQERVVVTHDLRTVPKYAFERTKAGLLIPGVVAVPDDLPIGQAIEDLAVVVECAAPTDIANLVLYLPL